MTSLLRVSVSLILLGLLVLATLVLGGCAGKTKVTRVPETGAIRMAWPEHITARVQ